MSPASILIFKQIKMKSIYSKPKVVKYDDLKKSWYVYFRYNGKLFRYKFGINYIKNYKKRLVEIEALRDALELKLKEGWNPNIPDNFAYNSTMDLIQALDYAFEKKKPLISDNTITAYNTAINFFKESVSLLSLDNICITDVKRIHIKTILDHVKTNKKWTNNSYNKNLGYLKAIFSELVNWDIIEINPSHGIKKLKTVESLPTKTATDNELQQIKNKIHSEFPSFFNFITTIFHTGIRPEELLKIKVSMIDLKESEIRMPPEIAKTPFYRIVPINQYLKKCFLEMDIQNSQSDYYLFGSFREHFNRGLKKELDFIPGPNKLSRDTASKLWRKLVKNGLEIDITMYSLKHLGGDKKILAGVELDALRELYGHTSKRMTERYTKTLKEINRKQIIEKSPDF